MNKVIFDLDGCLADDRWRRHRIPADKSSGSWYDYYSGLLADPAINTATFNHWAKNAHVVFVTGRPEQWRTLTMAWLDSVFNARTMTMPKEVELLMRPDEDTVTPSPELKVQLIRQAGHANAYIAFDDRVDVIEAYHDAFIFTAQLLPPPPTTPEVLREAAATFERRNVTYGDNYKRVGNVVQAMFPAGVPSELVVEPHWHLFELIVVKLTRLANSGLTHVDSVHDIAVYAAMIQKHLEEQYE